MWDMGFDHVEITNYPDDPAQKNIVGYNWGRVNPDEYIVVGGHFDIAYALTPRAVARRKVPTTTRPAQSSPWRWHRPLPRWNSIIPS